MVLDYQTNKSYITWGILILIGWNAECYKSAYFDAFQNIKSLYIKSLDGNYTRMQRMVKNISWKDKLRLKITRFIAVYKW